MKRAAAAAAAADSKGDSLSGHESRKSSRSEDSRNNDDSAEHVHQVSNSESGQNDSAVSSVVTAGAVASLKPGAGCTYPSPSNFPERLMHVLENGIASDAMFWLGDGDAIGIHSEKLKVSPVLDRHFQGNRYTSFIRNLNRWGFRRVSYHSVPNSVVAYHNSLFQKKKPRLAKYLQMDSDIQDVFERHQLTNDLQRAENGEPKRATQEDEDVALLQSIVKDKHKYKQDQGSAHSGNSMQDERSHVSQQQQQQQQQSVQQQHPSSNLPLQAQLAALLGGQFVQPQQQGQQSPQQAGFDPSMLGQLLSALSQQQENSAAASVSVCDSLLQQILPLAQQYLEQPPTEKTGDGSIRALLQLLILLGRQEQQLSQQAPQQVQVPHPQQQTGNNNANLLQQLMLQQIGQDNSQFQMQQNTGMQSQLQQGNVHNQTQQQMQMSTQPVTQSGNHASGATLDGFQQIFQQLQTGQSQNNPVLAQMMQMLGQQANQHQQ